MQELKNDWKVYAPATGELLAEMTETPLEEVKRIYDISKQAFSSWSALSLTERLVYFKRLREVMVEEMDELADVISKDTGKVKLEALVADIMPTIDGIRHIEKLAQKQLSRQKVSTPLLLIGKKSFIDYMPRGSVLVISPWNYPLQLAMIPIISALAGGNTVIAKPSEVTPVVGAYMGELFAKAGFPEGVIQVVNGGKELGAALTEQNPDYIFFTGSVRTGKIIGEAAAKKLIPYTLELGGKDPMIVFHDANLERAVNGAIWGAFTNSGQVCMSVERLYVERAVYDKFLSMLKNKVAQLTQGITENDDIGSMTFPDQLGIVRSHLLDALEKGATLETGVHPSQWEDGETMFLPQFVLSNVDHEMDIIREETFGPILPVIPFDTEEEAIKLANDSRFGLNSSVWTRDEAKADRVARSLVTGAVIINDVLVSVANHHLPFGGAKQSGVGRYHGENGLRMFCHEKAIVWDSGKKNTEIQWYPYRGKYPHFLSLFKNYFGTTRNWVKFAKEFLTLLKISK